MTPLTAADIVVGKRYRPKRTGYAREVIWIDPLKRQVQYDSDAVKDGQNFPVVSMEAFLKWAGGVEA